MGGLFQDWSGCVSPEGVATLNCVTVVFKNIITAAFIFAGIVALFFIGFAGIKFITSGGDPKQAEGAKQTLTYAIIGLILVLLSVFIINVIGYVTGARCINTFGFTNC